MALRDRLRSAAYDAMTNSDGSPAGARRASQAASLLASTAADHSTVAAAAIAGLGAVAVAAEGALSNYLYPPGDYASFAVNDGSGE
ncbi:hypothetical protein AS594_39270 [Streptomyces agglomeratus]|uniref:Uncharacterized protein n=1 Tax=Streptomyces agglomeratus TaxID=285458 RepID=A0A1E5NZ37_9ACTN|nr:hypothetical protein [Streptomyces agglomeratus]OEJ21575.1 hypothetical protein AS594_39270 [Streptomyces agglomeratus]